MSSSSMNPFATHQHHASFSQSPFPQSPFSSSPQSTIPPITNNPNSAISATSNSPIGQTSQNYAINLDNGPLPLSLLYNQYRDDLTTILESITTLKQSLILDKQLIGTLGLICDPTFLRSVGVESMYSLSAEEFTLNSSYITYFVRPTLENMRMIAHHILETRKTNKSAKFSAIFCPRKHYICEKELEDRGVRGEIETIYEFALDLIPLESDLLSCELPSAYRDTFLDGDINSLYIIARGLIRLQSLFGIIPVIKGKGNNALRVCNLVKGMRMEAGVERQQNNPMISFQSDPSSFHAIANGLLSTSLNSSSLFPFDVNGLSNQSTEISELILLDRNIDLCSIMVTPLTYEGLLDEIFTISNCTIDVDANLVTAPNPSGSGINTPPASGQKKKLLVNSSDSVFSFVRNLNFRSIGSLLAKKLNYVNETFEARHEAIGGSVSEMRDYMQKFKTAHVERQFLTIHVNIADYISQVTLKNKIFDRRLEIEKTMLEQSHYEECEEYIENCIAKQEDFYTVLKLLILFSYTNGFRSKKLEQWKRDMVQTFGFHILFILNNLEKLGVFSFRKSHWTAINKLLRCVQFDGTGASYIKGSQIVDSSYVCEGYVPISVRILELAAKSNWKRMEDLWNYFPGQLFEVRQDILMSTKYRLSPMPHMPEMTNYASFSLPSSVTYSNKDGVGITRSPSPQPDLLDSIPPEDDLEDEKRKPITLVFFIGGVTYAEIAALRWLSAQPSHPCEYVIAATKIINAKTFFSTLQEEVKNVQVR